MTNMRHQNSSSEPQKSTIRKVCGLFAVASILGAIGVSPGSAQTKAGGASVEKTRLSKEPGTQTVQQQVASGAIKLGVPRVSRSVMPPDECKKFKSKLVDRAAAKAANACDVVSTVTVTATQPATLPSTLSAVQVGCEGIGYRIHAQWKSDLNVWSASQDDWIDFYGTPSPCTNRSVSAHTTESINEHYCRADYGIGFGVDITQCYTNGNGSTTAVAGMRFTVHVIAEQVPIFFGHGVDITATNVNYTNDWAISGF
jgi:hypothetical protein